MSIKLQRALLTTIAVCVLVLLPLKDALARDLYASRASAKPGVLPLA